MAVYTMLKPLLMSMPPETAHRATLNMLRLRLGPRCHFKHDALKSDMFGLHFPNPLGLAAGFDKDAEALSGLFDMGFGFVETGTVTLHPQEGNPRPRLFRDQKNKSVINCMGFPGRGLDAFAARLAAFRRKKPSVRVGANIGVNKGSEDPIADYKTCFSRLAPWASYITVNVSCPNTQGLPDLQMRDDLNRLLTEMDEVHGKTPLLLKVSPDLTHEQREDVVEVVRQHRVEGLIVSNTSITRPDALPEKLKEQRGGLSGQLLKDLSTQAIMDYYDMTGGDLKIVGVGGIASVDDAWEKICAGASLVQVYTGLVYQGPRLVRDILAGLVEKLEAEGLSHISDAVGLAHKKDRASKGAVA